MRRVELLAEIYKVQGGHTEDIETNSTIRRDTRIEPQTSDEVGISISPPLAQSVQPQRTSLRAISAGLIVIT